MKSLIGKHRTGKLITLVVVFLLLACVVAPYAWATCTFAIIGQSSETDANMCTAGGTFWVDQLDIVKFTDRAVNDTVHTHYGAFRCDTDSAIIKRTSGTIVYTESEPWIDYTQYLVRLGYATTNVPNTFFQVDEDAAVSCMRSHPSPVTIEFANKALHYTSAEDGVDFDLSSRGVKDRIGWTQAGSESAFLIRGFSVTNGEQLWGNLNQQAPAIRDGESDNGFRALRLYDTNGDLRITNADPIFTELALWFDRNHNGISEAGEVESLAQRGIVGISLDYLTVGKKDQYGNLYRQRAKVQLEDGSTRWATDVYPAQAPTISTTTEIINPR